MKKIKFLLVTGLAMFTLNSCSSDKEEILMNQNIPDNDYVKNICPENSGPCGGISGKIKIIPDNEYVYSFSTSLLNPSIDWKVDVGSVQIISKNDKTATFKFNKDFKTGIIRAIGIGSNGNVEVVLHISKK
ncbi:MAG: hypothetical protein QM535_20160 [Limnohabitans sp.]|nr:hypothetical protein [Limnohabitans sp.]